MLAGAVVYCAYVLVLISLAFASNVNYIVAFRQLSVPPGAILGVGVLNEARMRRRLPAGSGLRSGDLEVRFFR